MLTKQVKNLLVHPGQALNKGVCMMETKYDLAHFMACVSIKEQAFWIPAHAGGVVISG